MNWFSVPQFVVAVNIVLRPDHEGGFTRDPRDNGNWTGGRRGVGVLKGTNHGISAASYPLLDIAHLTPAVCSKIYYNDWWCRYHYANLPDAISTKILDLAVQNPKEAHRCLQRALGTVDDGDLGPKTLLAAASVSLGSYALAAMVYEWILWCRGLDQPEYLKGREARANSLLIL